MSTGKEEVLPLRHGPSGWIAVEKLRNDRRFGIRIMAYAVPLQRLMTNNAVTVLVLESFLLLAAASV